MPGRPVKPGDDNFLWNLLARHDDVLQGSENRSRPWFAQALLARWPCGLSEAARADRAVPRLFVRPAAGAVRIDASDLDARIRCRPRHHRAVCAGRDALHTEIPVGATGRCPARAVLHTRL